MLITRIAPALSKITQAQLRCACFPSVLLQSADKMQSSNKMSTSAIGKQPNQLGSPLLMRSYNFNVSKAYSCKNQSQNPELPSKQELEKYFFKVAVVIWDLMCTLCTWLWAMFKKHCINNPTVQSNWKAFNEKLDEARKT